MKVRNNRGPLLGHLDEIEEKCLKGDITLAEIFKIFGAEGHFLLMLFMIIPFLQPMPLFGLSSPFGILLMTLAVFAYLKRPPWIPQRWAQKKIPAHIVSRIAESSERVFEKLNRILHPRWRFFFAGPFRTSNTIIIVLNAILLALPLPIPFSNAIPAWAILFQALAHLEEDGLFVVLSYAQTTFCLIYFFAIANGLKYFLDFI